MNALQDVQWRHPGFLATLASRPRVSLPLNPGYASASAGHAEKTALLRTLLATACLIVGSVLLIPIGVWLWRYPASALTAQEIQYLADPQTDFILYLGGRMIDSAAIVAIATLVGAVLFLAGLRTLLSSPDSRSPDGA